MTLKGVKPTICMGFIDGIDKRKKEEEAIQFYVQKRIKLIKE
jgi:hypothetical protein